MAVFCAGSEITAQFLNRDSISPAFLLFIYLSYFSPFIWLDIEYSGLKVELTIGIARHWFAISVTTDPSAMRISHAM
jgi:hypothetical protein